MTRMLRVELSWPEQNTVHVGDDLYFVLAREGTVHLIASTCAHRGGPLHLGEVQEGRLRCPWHGNSFKVDRLCVRGASVVQRGSQVIAYVPAKESAQDEPVVAHALVLAR
ncbi:Rieske 2Fe-2S domain-containing protein [Solihabitans fulvus]|uniref:Rieske 2Fe-2S domain-containing protein n=1 Tax=Solihabitans fulvus TaxID=1892852 RepID=A0A5B2XDV3_9PSEU|nr:Rieske 2Fe-2S domain-containing protein [Solihabitans fulvus]KAA2261406.1 Rieske 2Fe-2S domain-containing protein [Solihabitans fulvus]